MFKLVGKKSDCYGILDTTDNVVEYYTVPQIISIITDYKIKIQGVELRNGNLYFTELYDSDSLLNTFIKPLSVKVISEVNNYVTIVDTVHGFRYTIKGLNISKATSMLENAGIRVVDNRSYSTPGLLSNIIYNSICNRGCYLDGIKIKDSYKSVLKDLSFNNLEIYTSTAKMQFVDLSNGTLRINMVLDYYTILNLRELNINNVDLDSIKLFCRNRVHTLKIIFNAGSSLTASQVKKFKSVLSCNTVAKKPTIVRPGSKSKSTSSDSHTFKIIIDVGCDITKIPDNHNVIYNSDESYFKNMIYQVLNMPDETTLVQTRQVDTESQRRDYYLSIYKDKSSIVCSKKYIGLAFIFKGTDIYGAICVSPNIYKNRFYSEDDLVILLGDDLYSNLTEIANIDENGIVDTSYERSILSIPYEDFVGSSIVCLNAEFKNETRIFLWNDDGSIKFNGEYYIKDYYNNSTYRSDSNSLANLFADVLSTKSENFNPYRSIKTSNKDKVLILYDNHYKCYSRSDFNICYKEKRWGEEGYINHAFYGFDVSIRSFFNKVKANYTKKLLLKEQPKPELLSYYLGSDFKVRNSGTGFSGELLSFMYKDAKIFSLGVSRRRPTAFDAHDKCFSFDKDGCLFNVVSPSIKLIIDN